MNFLFIVLFCLILIVYLRFFVQPNPRVEILNVSISKVKTDHLFEKLPLVISESLVHPGDLVNTVLKYLYIQKKEKNVNMKKDSYFQNKHRYVIIYPTKDHQLLHIVHPKYSPFLKQFSKTRNTDELNKVQFIEVHLKKHQPIVLPLYWWYNTKKCYFDIIELHDCLSYALDLFI